MAHKDLVTKEVYEIVQARDWAAIYTDWATIVGPMAAKLAMRKVTICVAPLIDRSQWETCSGRSTLDHIKTDLRMGKRAPSDPDHLVSLCEGHTEAGAKAGYQWNTAHRAELRDYLARVRADRDLE